MRTGKAAVFIQPGSPMELREFPLTPVEPGVILVKVALANICGSDLHMWRGETRFGVGSGPWILGHEMAGRVYELGQGVSTDFLGQPLSPGDRVIYSYYKPCSRCYVCLQGNGAACPNRFASWWLPAESPPHFHGAYAQYYYLSPGQPVFKVPEELSDEIVAPVNCALAQVVFGLHQVGLRFGDSLVIQGAGGLGLYATAVAKEMGASMVVVIDRIDHRLELALRFGADLTINMNQLPTSKERLARIRELTRGYGADVVAELTGNPQAVAEGIPMIRQGGSYLWIGNISRGQTLELDPSTIVLANRRIVGVATYEPWAIPRALDFLKRTRDKYPYSQLLSHKFPLEKINQAFELASQGKVVRACIRIG